MIRYYKKTNPNQRVYLSTGAFIQFPTDNPAIGYLVISNEGIQSELSALMARGQGGVEEVNASEYEETVKKKVNSPDLRDLSPRQEPE